MKHPLFSIIIPAYNEELLLPRLLNSLKHQTHNNFEVIVVDANSADRTVKYAQKFSKSLNLKIISIKAKNISASRNLGASKAKGSFLFFIDADNFIYPSHLEKIEKLITSGYEMLIPAVLPDSQKFIYKFLYGTVNFLVEIAMRFNLPFSTGGNFIIKREAFQKIRGFDETIFVGEDHNIVGKALRGKVKIAFLRSPKVTFSTRRFEKEGVSVIIKYIVSTIHIAFFGKITKKIYNYQMGGEYFKKSPPKKLI